MKRAGSKPEPGDELTRDDIEFMIQVAQKQEALIANLEKALLANDIPAVLSIARKVCGLPEEAIQ